MQQQLRASYQLTDHLVNQKTLALSYDELKESEEYYIQLLSSVYPAALHAVLSDNTDFAYVDCIND